MYYELAFLSKNLLPPQFFYKFIVIGKVGSVFTGLRFLRYFALRELVRGVRGPVLSTVRA